MHVRAGIGPGLFLRARVPMQAPLPIARSPELRQASKPMHEPSATGPSRSRQAEPPWQLFLAIVPLLRAHARVPWQAFLPIWPEFAPQTLAALSSLRQLPADTLPLLPVHAMAP